VSFIAILNGENELLFHVDSIRPLLQCQPSITEVSEQLCQFCNHKWELMARFGIWTIFPLNFASWSAEFGKIFCGKLLVLITGSFWKNTHIMLFHKVLQQYKKHLL